MTTEMMERLRGMMPTLCLIFRPCPARGPNTLVPPPPRVLERIAKAEAAHENIRPRVLCEVCRLPGCIVWIWRVWMPKEEEMGELITT